MPVKAAPSTNKDPLLIALYEAIALDGRPQKTIAKAAGLYENALSGWRRYSPRVANMQAMLEVLGYELKIVKKGTELDARPACPTRATKAL